MRKVAAVGFGFWMAIAATGCAKPATIAKAPSASPATPEAAEATLVATDTAPREPADLKRSLRETAKEKERK